MSEDKFTSNNIYTIKQLELLGDRYNNVDEKTATNIAFLICGGLDDIIETLKQNDKLIKELKLAEAVNDVKLDEKDKLIAEMRETLDYYAEHCTCLTGEE